MDSDCEDQKYLKMEKLGSGSYGVVYKGLNTKNGEYVAMKKIEINLLDKGFPASYLREVSSLKSLRHENIVHLKDILWEDNFHIYLIFEYMMTDLYAYLRECEPNGLRLSALQNYFFQIVKGLEFCHVRGTIHRDLKPENVLIDHHGNVKIADFGLCRTISIPVRQYTANLVTLWYRSPELLLGIKCYAHSVDIWSLGCIFAEMSTGEALFMGDSQIDQIRKIFGILGVPEDETLPGVENLNFYRNEFKNKPRIGLQKKVLILIQKMLIHDPAKRISARKILHHQYFSGFDPFKRYPPFKKPKKIDLERKFEELS